MHTIETAYLGPFTLVLIYLKIRAGRARYSSPMVAFLYECPATHQKVQGWFADDVSENSEARYESVTCLACRGVHLVNPKTGKTLGADNE